MVNKGTIKQQTNNNKVNNKIRNVYVAFVFGWGFMFGYITRMIFS